MTLALRLAALAFGLGLTIFTLGSAIRTFVLPRAARDKLSSLVFNLSRKVFDLLIRFARDYEGRDRIMAFYAPVSLLLMPPIWLGLLTIAFTFIYYGLGTPTFATAFTVSGSSLLTLGFARSAAIFPVVEFIQAALGPLLIALLIAYLPTMYAAFQSRESMVNQLTVRAGSPPSPVTMLLRYQRLNRVTQLSEFWDEWEDWFIGIEESHTTLAALVFFRSPQSDQPWVNAAGCLLDAAALRLALLDLPGDRHDIPLPGGGTVPADASAAIAIRAGFIALRRIADFFEVPYNPDPHFPEDPISVTREDFDRAIELFYAAGIPLREDRNKAWQDFAGWRVNYDPALVALQGISMAPPANWLGRN